MWNSTSAKMYSRLSHDWYSKTMPCCVLMIQWRELKWGESTLWHWVWMWWFSNRVCWGFPLFVGYSDKEPAWGGVEREHTLQSGPCEYNYVHVRMLIIKLQCIAHFFHNWMLHMHGIKWKKGRYTERWYMQCIQVQCNNSSCQPRIWLKWP